MKIMLMDKLMLFTDGSVNTQSNIGYGAYLAVSEYGLSLESLKKCVKVKRFEYTSSTKLELQTLLWALSDIQALESKLIIYTDSQNILGYQEGGIDLRKMIIIQRKISVSKIMSYIRNFTE